MWRHCSPWLDKILAISVYVAKTLGRLGRIVSLKFIFRSGIDNRNDSQSPIHLNLGVAKARLVAMQRVSPGQYTQGQYTQGLYI